MCLRSMFIFFDFLSVGLLLQSQSLLLFLLFVGYEANVNGNGATGQNPCGSGTYSTGGVSRCTPVSAGMLVIIIAIYVFYI